jgi:acyl-CoA dehydrogenase
MVDFAATETTRQVRRSLDEFVERVVTPLEETHADAMTVDYRRLDDDGFLAPEFREAVETVRRQSGADGFWGMHMPESVGGGGLDTTELVQAIRHIYSHGLGLNVHIVENAPGPHPALLELDDHLIDEYVEPLVRGRRSACIAITESSSGSDALDMETTAELDGDEWVINGSKTWITNAAYADFGQVLAVTDPEEPKSGRFSSFLFPTDADGFSVRRSNRTIYNDGMQATVEFDGLRVPADHCIGEPGDGLRLTMETINSGRVRIAARCAGLMSYLLERAVEYAGTRTSWGEPIGNRQHVRGMVADIATWQRTTEALVLNAAWLIDRGEDPVEQSAMAKYYGTEKLFEAADNAVQIFGANGLTYDYPVQRVLRYARLLRIPEGTSEIQQETIASEVGLD